MQSQVKAKPVPVSDILKQIALYREYMHATVWFLAACYELAQRDSDALRAHGIRTLQLGAKFRAWRDSALENSATDRIPTPVEEI